MRRLTAIAWEMVRVGLQPGATAIDATAGNGHDTRFLAECVGERGRVFAFDIQPEAIEATRAAIMGFANVTLIQRNHAELGDAIPPEFHGSIGAAMFNLGYLPGGDKTKTTRPDSTVMALRAAFRLLREGGIVTVLAYTGHPGGAEEAEAVAQWVNATTPRLEAGDHGGAMISGRPCLFAVVKESEKRNRGRVMPTMRDKA